MKIVLGMSGGVDSSYALSALLDQGFEVEGATLMMAPDIPAQNALSQARSLCERYGVRHTTLDVASLFATHVINPFCAEYSKGYTPNPCVLCNRYVKIASLYAYARKSGADKIATGHYAQLTSVQGRMRLRRGADKKKDQSYFLARLEQEMLEELLFPLGTLEKSEVKQESHKESLVSSDIAESNDLCFVHSESYLRCNSSVQGGQFVSKDGTPLGNYTGASRFTIGQRKGIGLAQGPWYVHAIDPDAQTVVVDTAPPYTRSFVVKSLLGDIDEILSTHTTVQIRSTQRGLDAAYEQIDEDTIAVKLKKPEILASGQLAAFYDTDMVVGSGFIAQSEALL